MDNEAREKYLIAADEQQSINRDEIVDSAMRRNANFNAQHQMGAFGESHLEHLWPYMARRRRSPLPATFEHNGMSATLDNGYPFRKA